MAATTNIGKLIDVAREDREGVQVARTRFRESQEALRGLRSTHELVGDVLTDAELSAINEIAPPRKPRASKGND